MAPGKTVARVLSHTPMADVFIHPAVAARWGRGLPRQVGQLLLQHSKLAIEFAPRERDDTDLVDREEACWINRGSSSLVRRRASWSGSPRTRRKPRKSPSYGRRKHGSKLPIASCCGRLPSAREGPVEDLHGLPLATDGNRAPADEEGVARLR